jgi:hypothetical protein
MIRGCKGSIRPVRRICPELQIANIFCDGFVREFAEAAPKPQGLFFPIGVTK